MKTRTAILLFAFLIALCLYPLTRYAASIPREKLGQDAVDYVTLHGNVQSMTATTFGTDGKLRPIDVTGVYLFEGSANGTMISMLKYFPNLEHITIGPDFSGVPIGSPPPPLTEAAEDDRVKMQTAFPELTVAVSVPSNS
ncbi:hypothetical protein SH528x_003025 [Novipirellula sp. SH528]|uniref:hypothetical protein n=1 Tax=Novipirellula sp. SH528 TaxID=3454466 RepID=UPI003FA08D84